MTRKSGFRSLLSRAEKTDPDNPQYVFEDNDGARHDPRVVDIPVSLDKRKEVLVALLNHRVTIEAELAKLYSELENVKEQIQTHQIAFSNEMLSMGIKAPMASKEPPPLDEDKDE